MWNLQSSATFHCQQHQRLRTHVSAHYWPLHVQIFCHEFELHSALMSLHQLSSCFVPFLMTMCLKAKTTWKQYLLKNGLELHHQEDSYRQSVLNLDNKYFSIFSSEMFWVQNVNKVEGKVTSSIRELFTNKLWGSRWASISCNWPPMRRWIRWETMIRE